MKKVLALCLVIAMLASLSIAAFAAPNGFVSSPSGGRRPPVIEKFDPVDDDCTADLIITPFGDKNQLSEDERKEMEDAYDDIVNADNLGDLNKELADAAKEQGIDPDDLAVGDLIHLGCSGCEDHEGHVKFDVTLDAEGLDKLVGVIYRDENGDWHWVDDAKVQDGKLHFTGDGYHPYAIILDNTVVDEESSETSDTNTIIICIAVMVVTAAALAVVLIKGKKRHA